MKITIFKPITSILNVKATGSVKDISEELKIPDGTSIEKLLENNEEKKEKTENNQEPR